MKNRYQKGFLIMEFLISSAIFVFSVAALLLLVFQSRQALVSVNLRIEALALAEQNLNKSLEELAVDFDTSTSSTSSIIPIDNFTKKVVSTVSYHFNGRTMSISLSSLVVDTRESFGQSSCRPEQDISFWENPKTFSLDLVSGGQSVKATDIDLVGNFAYISSNGSVATDSDIVIADYSDLENPEVLSVLDTGPGAASLVVAGNYAYLANTSINSQLQVVDISDRHHPRLVSSYKLPGVYDDGTTVGNSIFYKKDRIFLGTKKSQIAELHIIDVSDPENVRETDSQEIGGAVNDIFSFRDRLYVATPNREELLVFYVNDGGDSSLIFSFDAPGGSGNGKRLSLFLNQLFLGRTVGQDEMYILSGDNTYHFPLGVSVQGVLAYGRLLFTALADKQDGFVVFDMSSGEPRRINTGLGKVYFPANPLNFDCDKSVFGVVLDQSSEVRFITGSSL